MLAVIPSRGGSKGIPRKNLAMCGGKSLLQRAIECAKQLTEDVVVSTDDDEITDIAKAYSTTVIRAYPPLCHGDNSLGFYVWKHAVESYENQTNLIADWSIYLEPTAPLRTSGVLRFLITKFRASGIHTAQPLAFTVEKVPAKYLAGRQFLEDGTLLENSTPHIPRQYRKPTVVKNGLVYLAHRSFFEGDMFKVRPHLMITAPTVNIDTYEDLEEAHRRLTDEH